MKFFLAALFILLTVKSLSEEVTLSGTVRDKDGKPMAGADISLKRPDFSEIAVTTSDEKGSYTLTVSPGTYFSFYACKDYREKFLEFWAWDVPLQEDLQLDALVDKLEVYGLNAVRVRYRGFHSVYVQFRPMSLSLAREMESKLQGELPTHIQIAPDFGKDDVTVLIEGEKAEVLSVTRIPEVCGEPGTGAELIDGCLVQVKIPAGLEENDDLRIRVHLRDPKTGDEGAGTVFLQGLAYQP